MPALNGQVISTITDANGAVAVQVTWFFNPVPDQITGLNALRNNPTDWTDGSGTVWPAGTGALIGANMMAQDVRMVIGTWDLTNPLAPVFNLIRRVLLPANTGRAATKSQLAAQLPPDGPWTTAQDMNGLTFDLSGAQIQHG